MNVKIEMNKQKGYAAGNVWGRIMVAAAVCSLLAIFSPAARAVSYEIDPTAAQAAEADNSKKDVKMDTKQDSRPESPGENPGKETGDGASNKANEGNASGVPAAGPAASTPGAAIPQFPDNDAVSFVKTLMALAFVLGLIFLAAWIFKKLMGVTHSPVRHNAIPINLISNRPLGEKKFLSIVEVQGAYFLVGVTPGAISLLAPLNLEIPEAPETPAPGQSFETVFNKARELLNFGKGKK